MSDCGCHERFVCDDCDAAFEHREHVACGWAFDAGVREAERDRAERHLVRIETAALTCPTDGDLHGLIDAIGDVLLGSRSPWWNDSNAQREAMYAAIAAERARCLAWAMWDKGVTRVASLGDKGIESGAPAPREG